MQLLLDSRSGGMIQYLQPVHGIVVYAVLRRTSRRTTSRASSWKLSAARTGGGQLVCTEIETFEDFISEACRRALEKSLP